MADTPQYNPQEQYLLDTLRAAGDKLSDQNRQRLWDGYHAKGDNPKDWVTNINKTDLDDQTKQDLYNMRWKGTSLDGKQINGSANAPQAVSQPGAIAASSGQVRPQQAASTAAPDPSGMASQSSIHASTPTLWDRFKAVVQPGVDKLMHGTLAQAGADQRLIAPEQVMTPLEQDKHPILRASGEFAGSLTSGGNVALIAGTGGLGEIPGVAGKLVPRLFSAGFSAQMIKGAYDQYKPFKDAMDAGDADGALYHLTHGVLSSAFGIHSGVEAVKPGPAGPVTGYKGAQLQEPVAPVGAAPRTGGNDTIFSNLDKATPATKAVDIGTQSGKESQGQATSTPLGPRNSATQQLQLDFTANAPTEAHAPQTAKEVPSHAAAMTDSSTAPLEAVSTNRAPDIIAPEPSQASQGASYRPTYTYKPSEKAATMSAQDVDRGPEFNAQSFQEEINRNNGIIRNPKATPEDVAVASDRLRDAKEGLARVQDSGKVVPEDVVAPKPESAKADEGPKSGGVSVTTDSNGTRWASDGENKVSVPKRIADADVADYAKDELAKQVEGKQRLEQTKASAPEPIGEAAPAPSGKWELPQHVEGHIKRLVDMDREKDNALTDTETEKADAAISTQRDVTRAAATAHINGLSREQTLQLRDDLTTKAARLDAQGNAISDLTDAHIKNRGIIGKNYGPMDERVKSPLVKLRETGGTWRRTVDDEGHSTGWTKEPADVKRGGRSVLDEMQGRVPTSKLEDIIPGQNYSGKWTEGKPSGMSDEEWDGHVSRMFAERTSIKKEISDAITMAADTGADFQEEDVKEKLNRLQQIEQIIGKYKEPAQAGRRPNLPPQLGPNGEIQAPEELKSWNLARAKAAFGRYVRQMPTDEEFYQEADARKEQARLYKVVADIANDKLGAKSKDNGSQRGAVGEGRPEMRNTGVEVPTTKVMIAAAIKAGLKTERVDDDHPSPSRAWLIPLENGKLWAVHIASTEHDMAAWEMLGRPTVDSGVSQETLLQQGFIRKATPTAYHVQRLDAPTIRTIETDLIRGSGLGTKWGEDVMLDVQSKYGTFGTKILAIDRGWTDLDAAIAKAKRDPVNDWANQSGKVSGIKPLAGSAIGSVAGAVVGGVVGGVHGAEIGAGIGWAAGFLSPAIWKSPVIVKSFANVLPKISKIGIDTAEWLNGPKQEPSMFTDMQDIIDAQQRDVGGAKIPFLQRMSMIPGDIYQKWSSSMFFMNDKPGTVANFMTKFDPRGKVFRDMKGQLSTDESPYAYAVMAAGKYAGTRDLNILAFKDIVKDANAAGLQNHLRTYLNLEGYQRVWDTMQENLQNAQNKEQSINTKLQSPNLGMHEQVGLENDHASARKEVDEIQKKMVSNTLTPNGYDANKIGQQKADMQSQMDPAKYKQVEDLANRVFRMNRKTLDLIHDNGIIGDDEYNTYTARGDKFVPMHRILDAMSQNEGKWSGTSSPLYLRQQNIIRALTGSDEINRDPIIASADAQNEATREVIRNGAIREALNAGSRDPQGVGKLFTSVHPDYHAKPSETLVGHYQDGKVQTYAVPSWYGESLKSSNVVAGDIAGKAALRFSQSLLRETATVGNLAWSSANALKHLGDMVILSKAGIDFTKPGTVPVQVAGLVRDYAKAWVSTVTKDPKWQEMIRSGAAYGVLQRNINPESQLSMKALGFESKTARGRVVDTVASVNRTIEDVVKLTSFSRLREAGYTEHAAAYETRKFGGGPDFAQMGVDTPTANLAFMFFNAHLRYVGRVFERAEEHPGQIGAAMGAITAMGMTLYAHNMSQKDDKGEMLLRKVPTNLRENNWVILSDKTYTSDNGAQMPYFYMVPKPSIVKFLYNPIENLIGKSLGHEDRSGAQIGLDAINAITPGQGQLDQDHLAKSAALGVVSSMNPALKVPVEEMANYKTANGGMPIVSPSLQKVDAAHQYTDKTPEIYKRMGQGGTTGAAAGATMGGTMGGYVGGATGAAVGAGVGAALGSAGISPLRAQHLVESFTAGVGRTSAKLADKVLKPDTKPFPFQGQQATQNSVSGTLIGRFVGSPPDQTEMTATKKFYDNTAQAKQIGATLDHIMKTNPGQAEAFMRAHQDDLWKAQLANDFEKRIGELNSVTKELQSNPDMSDEDKLNTLKAIHEAKMTALNTFNQVLTTKTGSQVAGSGEGKGNGIR